jgi:hypothetical protein
MSYYHLVMSSENRKTGPIPVSITSEETCPQACGMKGKGCYARFGPLKMTWDKVSNGKYGSSLKEFCKKIRTISRGSLWRHNQAGDLPGTGNRINPQELQQIVSANLGRKGFTYTHKPLTPFNVKAFKEANAQGFTINASADTLTDADKALDAGMPTVAVLPVDAPRGLKTPKGRTVAICPAQLNDKMNCYNCGLCQKADRNYVIGFRAHGTAIRMAEKLSKEDIIRRGLISQAIQATKK